MSIFATKAQVAALAKMLAKASTRRTVNAQTSFTTQGVVIKPTAKSSANTNAQSIVPRWG